MPTGHIYTRKMSYNERMFAAADRICPPVVNQLLFDGEGFLDIGLWRDAVAIASAANPGSRLVLRGLSGYSKWIDSGENPPVIEINAEGWDGMGPAGAPFLQDKMDLRKGPLCQVLLLRGNPLRVCFRTHHSIMDGRGTLAWAEDICSVLRGENPAGTSSTISDVELARSARTDYRTPFARDSIAPTGDAADNLQGVTWKRIIIPGKFRNILGQVAILTAKEAWRHGDGPVRFSIPVDLRQHIPGLRSTGNLSIAIYIEISRNSTPESVSADIKNQLTEKRDCLLDRSDHIISYIPLRLLTAIGKARLTTNFMKGKYGSSGIITNMTQVPLAPFSGGGFTATRFWGIPPAFENVPYFMGMTYTSHDLQLVLTMPNRLADKGRIDRLLDNIRSGLQQA